MTNGLIAIVGDALLGPAGRQRMRVSQSLLALVIYLLFAGVQHAEVLLGLIDRAEARRLGAAFVAAGILFYLAIRLGLNRRVTADRSLSVPQTVFGLTVAVGAYAITGPARGAVMTLLVLILVFTMFSLRPAQSRGLALFAFLLLGAAMAWKSSTDPARYPVAVEAVHLLFAAIVVGSVAVLAGRMGQMRSRLQTQKLELEQALERIGELATRDELTGLVNRRHMMSLLQAEHARQLRGTGGMTVALLDIDLFKRINDSHGHAAGDAVLKAFAETGRQVLRETDVLGRWGGEEFLLMLPGTSPEQALRSVERLRVALSERQFEPIAGLRVTFSAGLSACEDGVPLEACIERADQAMYRAKTQGRDCAVLA